MPDSRELARAVLAQSDEQLAEDCDWAWVTANQRPQLRIVHRSTGISVEVDVRKTEAQTRFIALLYLRNRFYDMVRTRGGSKK